MKTTIEIKGMAAEMEFVRRITEYVRR